jgi:Cd2+/Zn2+-exporting ATPase
VADRRGAPGFTTILHVLAYLAGGTGSAAVAWGALRARRIDVNLLMLLAAAGAAWLGHWAEGGALLFLFSLSNALEFYAMGRTRHAIRALMDLRPPIARVRRGAAEVAGPVEELAIGDVVVIRPAERLPVDGVVIAGASSIDQAPITGESVPVDVAEGSQVFAGTINQRGSLEVRVTRRAQDTTLARIVAMVEEAQATQAPSQRLIDRVGQVYAALVIAGAAATYGVLAALRWPHDVALYRAITLLVVASPCALVISTPASVLSAIANGARHGVLFKGGASLEALADVTTIVFDKTGTLTVGKPVITDVIALDGGDAGALLALAASLEQRSEHALADAVVGAAADRAVGARAVDAFESVPGRGVRGRIDGRLIRAGNERFMREEGVVIPGEAQARVTQLQQAGKVPIMVGAEKVLGILAASDRIREATPSAVRDLRALGVTRIVLLTGDHRRIAEATAQELALDRVDAELLPQDKAAIVRDLAGMGPVAMIGDGVNDAPALASATVGIAMGAAGTDAAMEVADVVLMGDDLRRLPYALALSRRAKQVIRQNLTFAIGVIVLLIVATLAFGLRLALGVIGHEGSTVIVVANGLRLLTFSRRRA